MCKTIWQKENIKITRKNYNIGSNYVKYIEGYVIGELQ